MKTLKIVVLILLLGYSHQLKGNDNNSDKKEFKHGIQFQIYHFLNLTNFDGSTFSYRYLLTSNSSLRFGVSPSFVNDENSFTAIFDSNTVNDNSIENISGIKFSVQYLKNIMSYKDFSLVVGLGPYISYTDLKNTKKYPRSEYMQTYKSTSQDLTYGLEILSGVEYRLTENVILSAEYSFSIFNSNTDYTELRKNEFYNNDEIELLDISGKIEKYGWRGNRVKIGLAIFF